MKPGDAINDWVHVNNLVQAHLLTVLALSSSCDNIAVRILILSLCLNYYISGGQTTNRGTKSDPPGVVCCI